MKILSLLLVLIAASVIPDVASASGGLAVVRNQNIVVRETFLSRLANRRAQNVIALPVQQFKAARVVELRQLPQAQYYVAPPVQTFVLPQQQIYVQPQAYVLPQVQTYAAPQCSSSAFFRVY